VTPSFIFPPFCAAYKVGQKKTISILTFQTEHQKSNIFKYGNVMPCLETIIVNQFRLEIRTTMTAMHILLSDKAITEWQHKCIEIEDKTGASSDLIC